MNALTERIEIIDSFEGIYSSRNESEKKRNWNNSRFFYLYVFLALVFVGIVLWSIVIELTDFQSKFNWNKASTSVLFSISALVNAVRGIYSRMLLKHLNFLEISTPKNVDERLNIELKKIITAKNKTMGTNVFIISLAIITLIGAVINFFMDNQFIYYKFFIAPTLIFYILTILEAVKTYKSIKANIDEVENTEHQPSFNYN